MGKVKGWLMEMEEDALIMPLDEWINKHGETQKHVYVSVNGESEEVINLVLGESLDRARQLADVLTVVKKGVTKCQ
jgi:hypothetical protein